MTLAQGFTHEDIARLERAHPEGVSAAVVVELLGRRGVHLAEATFRKYVQLGLLPRSRRVGRKGKHRGSHGLYPVGCVRRIAEIKALMEAGLTLEEIQRSAVTVGLEIDALRRAATGLLDRLDGELEARVTTGRGQIARRLQSLRGQVDELARRLEGATQEVFRAKVVDEEPATPQSGRKLVEGRTRIAARTAEAAGRRSNRPAGGRAR